MGKSKSAYLNKTRTARYRLFYHLKYVLKVNTHGMQVRAAVKYFCKHYGIRLTINPKKWLYETYENRSNEILNTKVPRRSRNSIPKDESYLGKLAEKARTYDYQQFMKSDYWQAVRKLVLNRDGRKCTKCFSDNKELHVHHLSYKNHFNEHNHLKDLITLCEFCHREIHRQAA